MSEKWSFSELFKHGIGSAIGHILYEGAKELWKALLIIIAIPLLAWMGATLQALPGWLQRVSGAVLNFLDADISVPTWALIAIALLLAVLAYGAWRFMKIGAAAVNRTAPPEPQSNMAATSAPAPNTDEPDFTPDEDEVLMVLGYSDGKPLVVSDMATLTEIPRLRLEEAVSNLSERGYLKDVMGGLGRAWYLSGSGRRLVIAKGYIRDKPAHR